MRDLLVGLGLVAVIEGLVLALAPFRFEDVLEALRKLSVQQRRTMGLTIGVVGLVLIWFAKGIGA